MAKRILILALATMGLLGLAAAFSVTSKKKVANTAAESQSSDGAKRAPLLVASGNLW